MRAAPTPALGARATARLTLPAPVGRSESCNEDGISYGNKSDHRERCGKMRAVARAVRGDVAAGHSVAPCAVILRVTDAVAKSSRGSDASNFVQIMFAVFAIPESGLVKTTSFTV